MVYMGVFFIFHYISVHFTVDNMVENALLFGKEKQILTADSSSELLLIIYAVITYQKLFERRKMK